MLLLFLAMALTDPQQAQHDREEWKIAHRIKAEQEAISDIWRPNARLVSGYRKHRAATLGSISIKSPVVTHHSPRLKPIWVTWS
jgi:hypothetical protein